MSVYRLIITVTILLMTLFSVAPAVAFLEPRYRSRLWIRLPRANQESPTEDDESQINKFLDTPFFDPSQINNDSPLKGFANLVENDYETAEVLFAGSFFVVLVIITQELLRMQLYGDSYVPLMHGGGGRGNLF